MNALSPTLFEGNPPVALNGRWLLFVAFASLCVAGFTLFEAEIVLPIALTALLIAGLTVRVPALWLVAVILFHLDILRRTEEISAGEILFAVVGFGYTFLWFIRRLLTGAKIIQHRADLLWFGFFGLCLLSAVPGVAYDVDPERWVRWLVFFLPYFLVFPAREILADRRVMPWVAGAFLILVTVFAAKNIIQYKSAASSAVYTWQLLSGRQSANEPLFMVGILLSLAVILISRRKIVRLGYFGLMAFFSVALVLTFSRGYWIGTALAVAVFGILLRWTARVRLVILIALVTVVSVFVFTLVFQNLGDSLFRTVTERLSAKSLNVVMDPSLRSRLMETREIIERIAENPLTGYGLGMNLTYYSPLAGAMFSNDYAHNAYLFLWFTLGIGGLMLFLAYYAARLIDAIRLARNHPSPFGQVIFAAMASIMVAMLAISMTSPQFYARGSVLMLVLMWSAMDAERRTMSTTA